MRVAGTGILAGLVGQDAARDRLGQAVLAGRLHHAYLLVGADGVGKRMLARGVAQVLLCAEPREGWACGACLPCIQVARGSHPDLHWLEPTPGTGRPASLGIDQVRRMIQEAAWRPYQGRWKVLVLAEADRLTPEAQNSLLKLLEEPPGAAVIFLTTSRSDRLLPTVRSRCHTVSLRTLSDQEVRSVLEARRPELVHEAARMAAAAQGRPGVALGLDPERMREQQGAAREWVLSMLTAAPWQKVTLAGELAERDDLPEVLEWAILRVRDLIAVQSQAATPLAHGHEREALEADAARFSRERLISLWRALREARQLVSGPAQRRLVLDHLALAVPGGGDRGR